MTKLLEVLAPYWPVLLAGAGALLLKFSPSLLAALGALLSTVESRTTNKAAFYARALRVALPIVYQLEVSFKRAAEDGVLSAAEREAIKAQALDALWKALGDEARRTYGDETLAKTILGGVIEIAVKLMQGRPIMPPAETPAPAPAPEPTRP